MARETRQISPYVVRAFDERLEEAVRRVSDGEATKAAVTLAFECHMDEDEGLVGSFQIKGGDVRKGEWVPSPAYQPRLPLEDESRNGNGHGLQATVSYSGESAPMDSPEARGLMRECLENVHAETGAEAALPVGDR